MPVLGSAAGRATARARIRPPAEHRALRAFNGNFGMFIRAYAYMRGWARGPSRPRCVSAESRYLGARIRRFRPMTDLRACRVADRERPHKEAARQDARRGQAPARRTAFTRRRCIPFGGQGCALIEPPRPKKKQTRMKFAEANVAIAKEARPSPTSSGPPPIPGWGARRGPVARKPRIRGSPRASQRWKLRATRRPPTIQGIRRIAWQAKSKPAGHRDQLRVRRLKRATAGSSVPQWDTPRTIPGKFAIRRKTISIA